MPASSSVLVLAYPLPACRVWRPIENCIIVVKSLYACFTAIFGQVGLTISMISSSAAAQLASDTELTASLKGLAHQQQQFQHQQQHHLLAISRFSRVFLLTPSLNPLPCHSSVLNPSSKDVGGVLHRVRVGSLTQASPWM